MKNSDKTALVPELRFPEFRGAGDWSKQKLGDAAFFYNGRAYKQEELLEQGKYRVLRVGNFFTNGSWYYSDLELEEAKYCEKGDLLYAWSASFGPHIWMGEKAIYHYHIWKVVEREGVDRAFLFVNLEYQTERMKAQSANGLGLLHITKATIENWGACFPKKLEQQKIAECLISVDELIAVQARKVDALKNHKKGLMEQLFPLEGKTQPRLRFPEFQGAGEWEIDALGQIADNLDNRRVPITSTDRGAGSVPYYGASGVVDYVDGFIFDEDLLCVSEDGANLVARTYPIAFPISGKTWVNNHAHVLRFNNGCTQKLVELYLNSIKLDSFITGMAQPKLNKAMLDSIPIPHPDIPEQERIADCLTALDGLVTAQTQKLKILKTHQEALMRQLFPSLEEVEA
ncbi:type I restriction enzyme S subunit [Bradyrhizobium japonicum]|uniref:Type I restriction enzyme S subunit n=1 Tax=Bradyrhizobium japonicum TaxID=375 RepID=A0ABV2SC40_BRAJP